MSVWKELTDRRESWLAAATSIGANADLDPFAALTLIEEGADLRRRWDEAEGDSISSAGRPDRCAILDGLRWLEESALNHLVGITPGSPPHRRLADFVEASLRRHQVYLTDVLTRPGMDPLRRAERLETFRLDLIWLTTLVAVLNDEPIADASYSHQLALDRAASWVGVLQHAKLPETHLSAWRSESSAVEKQLLQQRLATALADAPSASATPDQLWERRLALSRLMIDVERAFETYGASEADWDQASLERQQQDLTTQIQQQTAALTPLERTALHRRLLQQTRGEVNDVLSLLDATPLPMALRHLQETLSDIEALLDITQASTDADSTAIAADADRLARQTRAELQDKTIEHRLVCIFGRRLTQVWENLVLLLIVAVVVLIIVEWRFADWIHQRPAWIAVVAWADLAICTVFLVDFFVKLWLAPAVDRPVGGRQLAPWAGRWRYFLRHWFIDLFPSLPIGFLYYATLDHDASQAGSSALLVAVGQLFKFQWLVRLLRLVRPLAIVSRLAVLGMRMLDRLVQRCAPILNRNIILFEPESVDDEETRQQHLLTSLRHHLQARSEELQHRLLPIARVELARRVAREVKLRLASTATTPRPGRLVAPERLGRNIPLEAVMHRLMVMTPEELTHLMGPAFVKSVDRYVRLCDLPVLRRLPIIRTLVLYRDRGAGEVAALAANYLGHAIQSLLNVAYFFADLQATISGPLFLDHLGATIVKATATPAKRLITIGGAFMLVYLIVLASYGARSLRKPDDAPEGPLPVMYRVVDKLEHLLGAPVIVLGVICLLCWWIGAWFRKIANQDWEFYERIAEAQFASQTKRQKEQHREVDWTFIEQRVVKPELLLRSLDDATDASLASANHELLGDKADELVFLTNVQWLYHEYLDGSLLHRNDTKTTTQLLGNVAIWNLRNSGIAQPDEERRLQSLDLNRTSGGLLGGPFLWFHFVTRLLTRETARLLVEYNKHAVPLRRLACSSKPVRERYRDWLGKRLGVDPTTVPLPDPVGHHADKDWTQAAHRAQRRKLYETVDFTALDFLGKNPQRGAELNEKYGAQVAEAVAKDRRQNVRQAFRSYPLHQFPVSQRTVNLYALYEQHWASGRSLLIPFKLGWWLCGIAARSFRGVRHMIQDILNPVMSTDRPRDGDAYAIAERKIHRIRKPVFLETVWLRARFDIEYLGLPLPGLPLTVKSDALVTLDLDFVGAARRDRLAADRLRQQASEKLAWINKLLDELGWSGPGLAKFLQAEFPYLNQRSAEGLRALATALLVDYDEVFTMYTAIDTLRRLIEQALPENADLAKLPKNLPPKIPRGRRVANLPHWTTIFSLTCFPEVPIMARRRVEKHLRRHWSIVGPCISIVLGQGGDDPMGVIQTRLRSVLARADLWSDQLIALRTIQTLAILDVYHYCELIWDLGDYEELEQTTGAGIMPLPTVEPVNHG